MKSSLTFSLRHGLSISVVGSSLIAFIHNETTGNYILHHQKKADQHRPIVGGRAAKYSFVGGSGISFDGRWNQGCTSLVKYHHTTSVFTIQYLVNWIFFSSTSPIARVRVILCILKWPSWSVNFISLVTSCVGLWKEEPQTAHPMSFTWAYHIAASVLTGC